VKGSTREDNLLDYKLVKFGKQGWLSLDLTPALRQWQLDYTTNLGLVVRLVRPDRPGLEDLALHPVDTGFKPEQGEALPEREAFMVAYFVHQEQSASFSLGASHLRYRRETLGITAEEDEARSASEEGNQSEDYIQGRRRKRRTANQHRERGRQRQSSSLEKDFAYSSNAYRDFYGGRNR